MQTTHHHKPKLPKFLEVKLFIAAMTLAVTLGLWNLLSNNAIQIDKIASTAVVTIPAQPPAGLVLDLPPLPTLVAVIKVDPSNVSAINSAASDRPGSNLAQPAQLRSVAIPTQTIVQQNAPVVQSAVVVVNEGANGTASNGGKSAPVTTTRSSRPK